jgi:hypothetical protein
MEGLDSRYKGVLKEEQHAFRGKLYTATFPPTRSGSERPALQSYIANSSAAIPLSGYDHNYDSTAHLIRHPHPLNRALVVY